jgi:hypothetical protein
MVLPLKRWKSRASPGIAAGALEHEETHSRFQKGGTGPWFSGRLFLFSAAGLMVDAGWSSPVARQAHNLKVVGSNPTPATTFTGSKVCISKLLETKVQLKREPIRTG